MNDKIKIAYITKNMVINGISTVIMNYCKNMNLKKYSITIFAGNPIAEQYEVECKKMGINVEKMPPKRGGNPLKYYLYLLKKINKSDFDIVHVHGNSTTITIELLIAKLKGIKVRIAHCHNTTCDKKIVHKMLFPLFQQIYTNGFACSKEAGEWMFKNGNFEVLPNGFLTENFKFDNKNRIKIRKKIKIKNGFVIGHVGMFNDQKNHPFILNVFEKVAEKNKEAHLLLVGTGPDYDKIQKIISEHPYKERIICYGVTDKVSEVYDAMDLFLFPSKFEGLGIVLLEAQMKGLPCVASDVIPKEVVLNGKMIKFLSLNADREKWSEVILSSTKEIDRNLFFEKNKEKIEKYDIKRNVIELENKYRQYLNK